MSPPNMPLTSSTFSSPQSSNRGQEEAFALLHAVIISLITTVGGYEQFEFQSKKLSLFDAHGNFMRAVFVMLFFYASPIIWVFLVVGPTLRLFQQIIQWIRGIIQYIPADQTATSNLDIEETDSTGIQENGLPV